MTGNSPHPAMRRLLANDRTAQAFSTFAHDLTGADLTTLMLGIASERVTRVTAPEVLRQHQRDRFVAPSSFDGLVVARTELAVLESVSDSFEPVALAPTAPFGAHHALGATPQNNVITTSRGSEVTADPTNSLAIEAAARRAEQLRIDAKSSRGIHLAATHRVTRAQHFEGPRSFAHFSLLGLVSAGRDQGDFAFEIDAVELQVRALISAVRTMTRAPIHVRLTAFRPELEMPCSSLASRLSDDDVHGTTWPDRDRGRGYYQSVGFALCAEHEGERVDIGDGGDVFWTQDLLSNRKERLVIGGLGLERLVMVSGD